MFNAQVRMHNFRYGVIAPRGSQKQKIFLGFICDDLSQREVWAKVARNVEPEIMAKLTGMQDYGSFLPFHLGPGEEVNTTSTYLISTDVPPDLKRFTVTYQFELDEARETRVGVME